MARPPSDAGTRPDTRERLLDAADRLMWARGYEAVGVAELCAEAGAPRGSFYHWWPSKQALAAAMLQRSWQRVRTEVIVPSFTGPGTLAERIDRYAAVLERNMAEQQRTNGCVPGCRFGNFAAELANGDPVLRGEVALAFEEMCGLFATAIEEAIEAGEVPDDVDPRRAAEALCAHMEGLMILTKAHHDPSRIRRLATDARWLLRLQVDGPVETARPRQPRARRTGDRP
ncbi:MAG: TetR/AcrR family transcriptional regulator [Acidimicrobiia bacterium]